MGRTLEVDGDKSNYFSWFERDQALESLFLAKPPGSASNAAGAFSTGQSLPTTGAATPQGAAPSNPSDQFAQSTLSFLTSLQNTATGTVSGLLTDAKTAFTNDVSELTSALNTLKQALGGASGSTSSASAPSLAVSTSSAGASPLAAGTSSALLQALTQLGSTLQAFAALQGTGGGHHHHHHAGWGATQADASNNAATSSSSATPPVPTTTPTTG